MATTIQNIELPKKARALDTSGNNNHGQIYSGRGLEFDGVADNLTTGSDIEGVNKFSDGTAWTVTLWVYFTGEAGAYYIGDDAATYSMLIIQSTEELRFREATGGAFHEFNENNIINLNTWYRQTVVCNGTTITCYLNGEIWGSAITPDSTLMYFTGIGNPYESGGTRANALSGMMSDFQVWDAAWSAADVTYDYLNPELLALNNGGTALTESNLKLWYPMQDGHRGQQSYILDGANTGLGDEMLSQPVDLVSDFLVNSGGVIVDADTFTTAGGTFDGIRINSFFTIGTRYKLIIEGTTTSSGFTIGETTLSGNEYGSGFGTHYFTPIGTGSIWLRQQTAGTTNITSFSIKPINAKNHATTVFYGDELGPQGTFVDGDLTGWALQNDATNTTDGSSDYADITTSASSNSAIKTTSDFTTVVGRTYRVFFDRITGTDTSACYVDTSSETISSYSTTAASYTLDFVATATGHKVGFRGGGALANILLDNVSVKEVGVASGWTDADQQLHIPQTALQSYNELAWFDGVADYVDMGISANSDLGLTTTFTVSCWAMASQSSSQVFIFNFWQDTANGLGIKMHGTSIQIFDDMTANDDAVYSTVIKAGVWHHVVLSVNSSDMTLYVDGQSIGTGTDMTESLAAATYDLYIGSRNDTPTLSHEGVITETSIFNSALTAAQVQELYNDGKALDATTHSASGNLKGYWRNNGLSTWTDLSGEGNNGTPTSLTETILIPQGVDSTRDAQGFIMNKQKDTSCLNLTSETSNTYGVDLGSTSTFAAGEAFSITFWAKPRDITANRVMGFDGDDYLQFKDTNEFRIKANDVIDDLTINDPSSWTADEWVHISIVRNTSNLVTLYVNGTAQTDTETADEAFDYRYIGGLSSDKFRGQLDGFLIYDDELLAAEVLRNYNATKGSHRN